MQSAAKPKCATGYWDAKKSLETRNFHRQQKNFKYCEDQLSGLVIWIMIFVISEEGLGDPLSDVQTFNIIQFLTGDSE